VNDNEWHILTIKRRAKELEARVDNCLPATSQCMSVSSCISDSTKAGGVM